MANILHAVGLGMLGKYEQSKQMLLNIIAILCSRSCNKTFMLRKAYMALSNLLFSMGHYGASLSICESILQHSEENTANNTSFGHISMTILKEENKIHFGHYQDAICSLQRIATYLKRRNVSPFLLIRVYRVISTAYFHIQNDLLSLYYAENALSIAIRIYGIPCRNILIAKCKLLVANALIQLSSIAYANFVVNDASRQIIQFCEHQCYTRNHASYIQLMLVLGRLAVAMSNYEDATKLAMKTIKMAKICFGRRCVYTTNMSSYGCLFQTTNYNFIYRNIVVANVSLFASKVFVLMSYFEEVQQLLENIFDILLPTTSRRHPLYISAYIEKMCFFANTSSVINFVDSNEKLKKLFTHYLSLSDKIVICQLNCYINLFQGAHEKALSFLNDVHSGLFRQFNWLNQNRCIHINRLKFLFHPKFAVLAADYAMLYYYVEKFDRSCEYASAAITIYRSFVSNHCSISIMLRIFLVSKCTLGTALADRKNTINLKSIHYKSIRGGIIPYTLLDNAKNINKCLQRIAIDCKKLIENTFSANSPQ